MKYIKDYQNRNDLVADGIIGPKTLNSMIGKWNLKKMELAHFLGQTHHETNGFVYGIENLNYSANNLLETFPYYFKTYEQAKEYEFQPQKLANYVYNDKFRLNPLGNVLENDGWNFRGRGCLMLTGRNNYNKFANYVNDSKILCDRDKVQYDYYFETGLWFFDDLNIWRFTTKMNDEAIRKVSKKVNGGLIGIKDRINLTYYYWNLIKTI